MSNLCFSVNTVSLLFDVYTRHLLPCHSVWVTTRTLMQQAANMLLTTDTTFSSHRPGSHRNSMQLTRSATTLRPAWAFRLSPDAKVLTSTTP